jgi:hypothetical protein
MNLYHVWCNLKPGADDLKFGADLQAYLGALRDAGRIAAYRVTRRKLGLGPRELGEWHVIVEVEDLAQLDAAFVEVSARGEPLEGLHAAVNQAACDVRFALYRDFPDPHRQRGAERF